TGTGQSITLTTTTNTSGYYSFSNLQPGTYSVTETQPPNSMDGKETVGTVNGTTDGTSTTNDVIASIVLKCNNAGINYNFGELAIFKGQTATIGFWHNKNGQA